VEVRRNEAARIIVPFLPVFLLPGPGFREFTVSVPWCGAAVALFLQDSIAIALEDNLDVELQRMAAGFAGTDIKHTQAAALPPGVPFSVREGMAARGGRGPHGGARSFEDVNRVGVTIRIGNVPFEVISTLAEAGGGHQRAGSGRPDPDPAAHGAAPGVRGGPDIFAQVRNEGLMEQTAAAPARVAARTSPAGARPRG
jgi:hypothetical protein